jgi:hypothetical protein
MSCSFDETSEQRASASGALLSVEGGGGRRVDFYARRHMAVEARKNVNLVSGRGKTITVNPPSRSCFAPVRVTVSR